MLVNLPSDVFRRGHQGTAPPPPIGLTFRFLKHVFLHGSMVNSWPPLYEVLYTPLTLPRTPYRMYIILTTCVKVVNTIVLIKWYVLQEDR